MAGSYQPPPRLDLKLYQRGGSLVALVLDPGPITIAVDGVAKAGPPTAGQPSSWLRFGEHPRAEVEVDDVIEVSTASTLSYWHWDGAWSQLASFAPPTLEAAAPTLGAAGTWLWRQLQQRNTRQLLRWVASHPQEWARDAALRARTQRALTLIGADSATLARITAAASQLQ